MIRTRWLPVLTIALLASACSPREGKTPGGGADSSGASNAEAGSYLLVVAPSVVRRGEDFPVRLRVITQAGIPDYDYGENLRLRVETSGPARFPAGGLKLEPTPDGTYDGTGIAFEQAGVQRIRGLVPEDTLVALGNPINVVESPEWNVYWGDLNGHTDLSSGSRAPAVYWWYAKAVALLDFAALTDNDRAGDKTLDDESFAHVADITQEFDLPGRFVPIVGFEWTSAERGNRIVLFPTPPATLPAPGRGVDTPEKLRAALPPGSVIILPHPSGSAHDPATDPALAGTGREDLVEIYSALGVFERPGTHRPSTRETTGAFVTDLLGRQFRGGFVANSDTRLTTPGNSRAPLAGDHRYPGGLTAILARELTREAVLEALRARRCYATTGPRFLLEFTVDGAQMGSELTVKRGHVAEVYGSVGANTNWTRVEILGPGGPLGVLTPAPPNADVVELRAQTPPLREPTWVYLRAVDERGDMAWSSPVWLIPG